MLGVSCGAWRVCMLACASGTVGVWWGQTQREGEERDRFGVRGVPRCAQGVHDGRGGGCGRRRDDVRHRARRARGGGGALGRRQDHAPEHAGRHGRVLVGHHHAGRARNQRVQQQGAHLLPPLRHRLRVPVLQRRAEPHGAGERGAGEPDLQGPARCGRGACPGGAGASAGQLPRPALRRRAAARGHRPRAGEEPEAASVRRAHRCAGLPYRQGHPAAVAGHVLRHRQDRRAHHAQLGVHGHSRPRHLHPRGARGGRRDQRGPAVGRRLGVGGERA